MHVTLVSRWVRMWCHVGSECVTCCFRTTILSLIGYLRQYLYRGNGFSSQAIADNICDFSSTFFLLSLKGEDYI